MTHYTPDLDIADPTPSLTADNFHPDDLFHVIIDALYIHKERIERDDRFRPWEDYDRDPEYDAKSTEDGYLAVLDLARQVGESLLNSGTASRSAMALSGVKEPGL